MIPSIKKPPMTTPAVNIAMISLIPILYFPFFLINTTNIQQKRTPTKPFNEKLLTIF